MKTNIRDVGSLLTARRKEKGLTQTQVGERIGIKKAMVSKIESGASVNVASIERLAEALGVEPLVELRPIAKPDKDVIDYVMTAIIEFAKSHKLTIREASNYLNRFKGIDLLSEFYDVELTLSFNDCIADLTVVCSKNGGALVLFSLGGGIDNAEENMTKDKTFQYLFEGISSDVVRYLVERDDMMLAEAISTFHNSETFAKLEDPETGLYIESPAYIYDLLQSELRNGKLVP